MQEAAERCPHLFSSLLSFPLVDQQADKYDSEAQITAKTKHNTAMSTDIHTDIMLSKPCASPYSALPSNLSLAPVDHPFVQSIRKAYSDCGLNNMMVPGSSSILWFSKVSFIFTRKSKAYLVY